ncbi:MAG: glutaminyl-peptide cyclotransferase [Euryarchaeota archaeon]|nr:glutaminyl-peptide cyclotransferase [Euryarchaeota archaeon]
MEQASDMQRWIGALFASALVISSLQYTYIKEVSGESPSNSDLQLMQVNITKEVEHDEQAFTQGLLWHGGMLYESTGLEGESTLRELNPNGTVNRSVDLNETLFGEGLARVGEKLIQLTWKNGIALVWNISDFQLESQFEYEGEGWGLCNDGTDLVMSNGSSNLSFRKYDDFSIVRHLNVSLDGQPVSNLNELECAGGYIWANIYLTDNIIRINSSTGIVDLFINASSLSELQTGGSNDVLNGIAIDDEGKMWLTGKKWNSLYEVELIEVEEIVDTVVQDPVPNPVIQSCSDCEEQEEDVSLQLYMIYSLLPIAALTTAVIGMFKVWRRPQDGEAKALAPMDVFEDDE